MDRESFILGFEKQAAISQKLLSGAAWKEKIEALRAARKAAKPLGNVVKKSISTGVKKIDGAGYSNRFKQQAYDMRAKGAGNFKKYLG